METDEYFKRLDHQLDAMSELVPAMYFNAVARRWRTEIAPGKHREYGAECWERLGAKGLVAELVSCYYRFKRQKERGHRLDHPAMSNAVLDCHGYSQIYAVCCDTSQYEFDIRSGQEYGTDPEILKESLISYCWDHNYHWPGLALQLAVSMWAEA